MQVIYYARGTTTEGDTMTDTTDAAQEWAHTVAELGTAKLDAQDEAARADADAAQEWADLVVQLGTEKLDAQDEAERQGRA